MLLLLLLFIVLPSLEIIVLIEVGSKIGALPTLALIFLTAFAGLALMRQQGLSTLLKAKQKLAEGVVPADEMLAGMLLGLGGILLFIPGFVTDFCGLLCLLPISRRYLIRWLLARFNANTKRHQFPPTNKRQQHATDTQQHHPRTFDGKYRRED